MRQDEEGDGGGERERRGEGDKLRGTDGKVTSLIGARCRPGNCVRASLCPRVRNTDILMALRTRGGSGGGGGEGTTTHRRKREQYSPGPDGDGGAGDQFENLELCTRIKITV